jgi:hypothetical protein
MWWCQRDIAALFVEQMLSLVVVTMVVVGVVEIDRLAAAGRARWPLQSCRK